MPASEPQKVLLDVFNKILTISREELDLVFCGLVGAEKTVFFIISASVDRSRHDLVQTEDPLGACCLQDAPGADAGVDVAVDDIFRIGKDRLRVIGEDDLDLGAAGADQIHVIGDVVHTGKGVELITEERPVRLQIQHVLVGIDALFVQGLGIDQMVADLIGGVGEHQDDLFGAFCNAPQANGKAVAAENRENHANRLAAELIPHVCRNIIDSRIIPLCAGDDGLGHGHNVAVADLIPLLFCRFDHTVYHDLSQIVAFADDRGADASGYGTDHSAHNEHLAVSLALTKRVYRIKRFL